MFVCIWPMIRPSLMVITRSNRDSTLLIMRYTNQPSSVECLKQQIRALCRPGIEPSCRFIKEIEFPMLIKKA